MTGQSALQAAVVCPWVSFDAQQSAQQSATPERQHGSRQCPVVILSANMLRCCMQTSLTLPCSRSTLTEMGKQMTRGQTKSPRCAAFFHVEFLIQFP